MAILGNNIGSEDESFALRFEAFLFTTFNAALKFPLVELNTGLLNVMLETFELDFLFAIIGGSFVLEFLFIIVAFFDECVLIVFDTL